MALKLLPPITGISTLSSTSLKFLWAENVLYKSSLAKNVSLSQVVPGFFRFAISCIALRWHDRWKDEANVRRRIIHIIPSWMAPKLRNIPGIEKRPGVLAQVGKWRIFKEFALRYWFDQKLCSTPVAITWNRKGGAQLSHTIIQYECDPHWLDNSGFV